MTSFSSYLKYKNLNFILTACCFAATLCFSHPAAAQISSSYVEEDRMAPFRNGFAKITDKGRVYYINVHGEKIDLAETTPVSFNDAYSVQDYQREIKEEADFLPKSVLKYLKNGKIGIISPKGDLLLAADYDDIDIEFRQFWKVKRNGKVSLFLADKTFLPYFDDIGYLDGEYFDVKQNGKWYLYSKLQNKVTTSQGYDAFDYCGGCGNGSTYVYAQQNGKWGVMDWSEKVLVPFKYEHAHWNMRSDNWVASFSKNGQPLIIHIPSKREFVDAKILTGVLLVKENNKYGVYGQDGDLIIPFDFDNIELPNDNSYLGYYGDYLLTTKQHKKGISDLTGAVVIPNEYDDIKVYDDYFVVKKQQKSYLMDKTRKVLFEIENGEVTHVNDYFYSSGSNNLATFKIKKGAYYGLYFANTNTYIEPQYYKIDLFKFKNNEPKEQYIITEKNKISSLFDQDGHLLLSDVEGISELYDALENLMTFIKNGQMGIYDLDTKKEIIPPVYDSFIMGKFGNRNLIKANNVRKKDTDDMDNQSSDLYDLTGKKILEIAIQRIDTIGVKYCLIKDIKGKYLLLNMDDMELQAFDYQSVYPINNPNLLLVSKNDKTGVLYDIKAKKELKGAFSVIYVKEGYLPKDPGKETVILPYKGDMALLYNERGYGYINNTGEVIVSPQYVWAFDFRGDAAMVCQSENSDSRALVFKMGFINKKGALIFPLTYDLTNSRLNHEESVFINNLVFLPKVNGYEYLYGLGDLTTGNEVLPVEYTQIRALQNGTYFLLQKNNKFGISDAKGKIIVPIEFEEILFDAPTFFDAPFDAKQNIFPLLVYREAVWKYIDEKGNYLKIQ